MVSTSRDDIRALLKSFGIEADGAVIAHLARNPQIKTLRIRLTLEDLTDYGDAPPDETLAIKLERDIGHRDEPPI